MALSYEGRFYRLDSVETPPVGSGRWTYRFSLWPEGLVFRRLVDYEQDCAARAPAPPQLHFTAVALAVRQGRTLTGARRF